VPAITSDPATVRRSARTFLALAALALASGATLTACASGSAATGARGAIAVVAAENSWGSIARQLGGTHVNVTSIITNPNTDPHVYEPTAQDARAMATAEVVIVNGIGYDPWTTHLLAADPSPGRVVLNVGSLAGIPEGGNPHRWYSPDNVHQVIEQIAADYARVDPAEAPYYAQRKQAFETQTLSQYSSLIQHIRAQYARTPIGASESIVSPLADALGLIMLTPYSFLRAISEGTDPTAADKATIDAQIRQHQIKVYIYNSQNSTPDVAAQVDAARAQGIPVTTVTETLVPSTATFQAWQVKELRGIEAALARAIGH
jgi:zinc/manganese transport system substrate-binding protein